MLADLPLVFACGQFFDEFPQFLWPIGPKARHHSIEQQHQGNDRNQIRPEQPRPTERTDPRSADEQHERKSKYKPDRSRSAPRCFKYADAFPGIDGILEYGASLFWRKMMERREHRSQPRQFTRNFHRVHRPRIKGNVILRSRSNIFECPEVGVFICEPNLKDRRISFELSRLELSRKA